MSRNREISKGPLCTISFTGRLRIQSVDSWKHHEQCLVRHPRSHHRALSSSCTEWRREGLALRTRTCPKNSPLNCPFLFFLIPEWTLGSGLRREAEGLHLLHSRASNSRQEPRAGDWGLQQRVRWPRAVGRAIGAAGMRGLGEPQAYTLITGGRSPVTVQENRGIVGPVLPDFPIFKKIRIFI